MLTRKLQSTHPLLVGLAVSALATVASYFMPEEYASSAVAFIFLGATHVFALPANAVLPPSHFGLSLGGLLDAERLSPVRMLRDSTRAFAEGSLVALVILGPFVVGFLAWYAPSADFSWERAVVSPEGAGLVPFLSSVVLWHLLGVALPEEAFFRGYLQTSLDDRARKGFTLAGRRFTWALISVSILFALGHFATEPHPARLAVFFPSLLFGVTRTMTGGIGAAAVLHAECNVMSQILGQGYGLY